MEFLTHYNIIFLEKYLKLKEIKQIRIHYSNFQMWPVRNSARIIEFLALGKTLLGRLYSLYLTEDLKTLME